MAKMQSLCWAEFPHFQPAEFKCPCGCEKQRINMDCDLLRILEKVRKKYGPTTITCGHRCQKYNDRIPGSVKSSYHVKGKAADFWVEKCKTEKGRKEVMAYIKTLTGYKYTYCNIGGNHPNMGQAIHIEVK